MQATRPQEPSAPTQTTTEATPPVPSTSAPTAVLRLRGRALHSAKVAWTEEVVDNEFMGKKKSKSTSPLEVALTPTLPPELELIPLSRSLLHLPQASPVR